MTEMLAGSGASTGPPGVSGEEISGMLPISLQSGGNGLSRGWSASSQSCENGVSGALSGAPGPEAISEGNRLSTPLAS